MSYENQRAQEENPNGTPFEYPMTHAYLRVSTDAQDPANQWAEITHWAADHGLPYPEATHDTASTKTEWRSRMIGQIIQKALPGDTIIVAEVSRLARSILEVLEILKECAAKGVAVHVVKSGLILDGSLPAKITVTILALAAEIERDLIRARTKSALAEAKAKGKTLGRPVGTGGKTKIDSRASEIARLLSAGVAKTAIARLLGVSRGTVNRHTTNQEQPT